MDSTQKVTTRTAAGSSLITKSTADYDKENAPVISDWNLLHKEEPQEESSSSSFNLLPAKRVAITTDKSKSILDQSIEEVKQEQEESYVEPTKSNDISQKIKAFHEKVAMLRDADKLQKRLEI